MAFDSHRPDAHAPIGVMGDHVHEAGEWMLSFRYMRMSMDGMRSGTDSLDSADVFAEGYVIAPTEMTMDMLMAGVMFAPSDSLTLMAMVMYEWNEMDHDINPVTPLSLFNGGRNTFTTESSGFGDVVLTALYSIYERDRMKAHVGLGISLPTGSIGERDTIPVPRIGRAERQLPAAMQPGTGSFAAIPSVTVLRQQEVWSAGAQAKATIRLNENWRDYKLGNVFELNGWAAWLVSEWVSLEGRLRYLWEDKLDGQQVNLLLNPPFNRNARTVPTAFSENYGGQQIEGGIGVNVTVPRGSLVGHRLAVELLVPLHQDVNGLRLATDWTVIAGWQKAF